MTDRRYTVQGNEVNGYMVVENVEGQWVAVTDRFLTYDDAAWQISNVFEAIR